LQPITHLINKSFVIGIVPQDLKIAKVIPIYRSFDQSLRQNYRPLSLLTAISKILEIIMYKKLLSFLELILFKQQYVFRPKYSTIHPIIQLLNYSAESSNKPKPEITLAIFCQVTSSNSFYPDCFPQYSQATISSRPCYFLLFYCYCCCCCSITKKYILTPKTQTVQPKYQLHVHQALI